MLNMLYIIVFSMGEKSSTIVQMMYPYQNGEVNIFLQINFTWPIGSTLRACATDRRWRAIDSLWGLLKCWSCSWCICGLHWIRCCYCASRWRKDEICWFLFIIKDISLFTKLAVTDVSNGVAYFQPLNPKQDGTSNWQSCSNDGNVERPVCFNLLKQ